MFYANCRVTVTDTGGCPITSITDGVVTATTAAQSSTHDFVRVNLDKANNILTGWKADGTQIVFESGADLTIAITPGYPSSSSA
jgi:hypothetical protein